METPSPVGDGSVTQADTLPMDSAMLPDASMAPDVGGMLQDPVLAEAVQTILTALMARQGAVA